MKKAIFTAAFCAAAAFASLAQTVPSARGASAEAAQGAGLTSAQAPGSADRATLTTPNRLEIALSSPEYPVTPSDVYRLTYRQSSGEPIIVMLQVPGDYRIDLGLFGIIDATRLSFLELKSRVEILVAGSYSRSYPTLTIESVGSFRVAIGGAGMRFEYIAAWGLSRLGDIVGEVADRTKASMRKVQLARQGQESRAYDILLAQLAPGNDGNPLLAPGDTITLVPVGQAIRLSGEIRRAGAYELLPGEGARELIESFGGGVTELADPSRVRVDRRLASGVRAEYYSLEEVYAKLKDLRDCEGLTIFSRDIGPALVYFEGAVSSSQGDLSSAGRAAVQGQGSTMTANPWISCPIVEGEKLSDTLGFIKERLAPLADLSAATLLRSGSQPVPIDLASLMASGGQALDVTLQANDRIYIPEMNSRVTVSGAVIAPGAFAFQPTSPASYYITHAGGIDPECNNNGSYWVSDSKGRRKDPKAPLQGGDRIYVPANAIGYNVVRYLPVVTGVITMLISIETLVQLVYANIR